jgi:hypothetical protein
MGDDMSHIGWIAIIVVGIVAALLVYLWRPRRSAARTVPLLRAKQRFRLQREGLEARFVQLVTAGARRGVPRWADCSFDDDVAYVRNRATGELSAFVAVTIATDAATATSSSASKTVGNLQAGTAVFRFDRDHWVTDGRAILNLSPVEAVHRFGDDLEIVNEDLAQRT